MAVGLNIVELLANPSKTEFKARRGVPGLSQEANERALRRGRARASRHSETRGSSETLCAFISSLSNSRQVQNLNKEKSLPFADDTRPSSAVRRNSVGFVGIPLVFSSVWVETRVWALESVRSRVL